MVREKAVFDERFTEVTAELHPQMNSSLKCTWKWQICLEDYIELLQGLKEACAAAEYVWRWCQGTGFGLGSMSMLTGSSGSGSYGSMIVSSEFSAPWWGFLFQVFLSCQISLMSSTCPFPPVPGCLHLLLLWALIQFHYLCQTSSISGCFAWFLGWLWAGLDSGESCEPTAPWIKLLKHSPTGFPAFWILSIVTVEGVMYLWVSNNRCQ